MSSWRPSLSVVPSPLISRANAIPNGFSDLSRAAVSRGALSANYSERGRSYVAHSQSWEERWRNITLRWQRHTSSMGMVTWEEPQG